MNKLSVVVSSTRPQRIGGRVGSWVASQLEPDWDLTVLDLAEIDLPFLDEDAVPGSGIYTQPHTLAWKAAIDDADVIVVVTPEYNGFFPAPLKNAIDYLYAEWEGKPMGLVGYGFGGGARATTALAQLLANVKADVVGSVGLQFEADLTHTGEVTADEAKIAELAATSAKLSSARGQREVAA